MRYLYHVDGWNLKEPNLILSVMGSTNRYDIPSRVRKAFKQGLIKAATTTGAWIITYGTTTGVTKLVSEIIYDQAKNENLILLGIAQWGKTALKEKLIVNVFGIFLTFFFFNYFLFFFVKRKNNHSIVKDRYYYNASSKTLVQTASSDDLPLDSNHTHFLLFDDGSQGILDKSHCFRTDFENEMRKGYTEHDYENPDEIQGEKEKTPIILIIVQGGFSTLKSIEEALNNETPVLLIAVSVASAFFFKKNNFFFKFKANKRLCRSNYKCTCIGKSKVKYLHCFVFKI